MCNCEGRRYFTNEHTVVCAECGREDRVYSLEDPSNMSYSQSYHIDNHNSYSRVKRFGQMLDQVVLAQPSPADNKMLEHLNALKTFPTTESLLESVKASPLRDKRYASLHLFHRLFVDSYKPLRRPRNWFDFKRRILSMFDAVEFTHTKYNTEPFVSYSWIMRRFLTLFGLSQYLCFVKPMKCEKRALKYHNQFERCLRLLETKGMPARVWGVSAASVPPHDEHLERRSKHPDQIRD